MSVNVIRDSLLIHTIDDVFTPAYCDELIKTSEAQQYETAQITIAQEQYKTDLSVRNNDRLIFNDAALADTLFALIKPYLPETWDEGLWEISGLNPRFRYYRYTQGQTFKPHFDGAYERRRGHKSFLTLLFYLNDDFTGGETKFYQWRGGYFENDKPTFVITPKQGQTLLFDHRQLHEGSPVTSGVKYVLRTDVMYHALVL